MKHPHAEFIVAFVAGNAVELTFEGNQSDEVGWQDVTQLVQFDNPRLKFRIKRKTISRQGWINVYPGAPTDIDRVGGNIHATKADADIDAGPCRVACVLIKWPEVVR